MVPEELITVHQAQLGVGAAIHGTRKRRRSCYTDVVLMDVHVIVVIMCNLSPFVGVPWWKR